ncbi:MAG: type II toxin-antitoxin system VapC family toxin [Actinobacteria bacterium]|nr:type II toxin-antitoxin system VapC family toxin [Actinomycetota bacterium]
MHEHIHKRYVVDASVAVKWFSQANEKDIEVALRLQELHLSKQSILTVPDLLFYEVANALRYNVNFTEDDLAAAFISLTKLNLDAYPPSGGLIEESLKIARLHDVTVYDASYVALAQLLGCACITADSKFSRKAKNIPQLIEISELAVNLSKGT